MGRSFDDEDGWEDASIDAPDLLVEFDDPQALGAILGPDGDPIHIVMEPRPFPFGFSKGS
jgi:hypothetical protein